MEENKRIEFIYPDAKLLHSLLGAQISRFLIRLSDRGINIGVNNAEQLDVADAELDMFCDRLIEMLAGERAFN